MAEQRENTAFQSDIDALTQLCFSGNVEQKIKELREVFIKIRRGEDVSTIVQGHFVNLQTLWLFSFLDHSRPNYS